MDLNLIIVPHEASKKLQEIFKKSAPFVRKCLRGERNSDIARKIRKAALENGGTEMKVVENDKSKTL